VTSVPDEQTGVELATVTVAGPPSTLFEEMPPLEAELVEARVPSAGIPSPAAPTSAGGS
jgi:hypothetical protein